jgi:hypothetical protein
MVSIIIYILTYFRIVLHLTHKPPVHWNDVEECLLTGMIPSQIYNDLGVVSYYKFESKILIAYYQLQLIFSLFRIFFFNIYM